MELREAGRGEGQDKARIAVEPLRVLQVYDETIADGDGLRLSVYLAGCSHNCPGCHNPGSHDPRAGAELDGAFALEIARRVNANPLLDGVTLSGGDPLYNPRALLEFLKFLKRRTRANVWCYTGYVYERILKDPERARCLKYIDTLVDGPFIEALRDPSLAFVGSANQRIIPLRRGLAKSPLPRPRA